MYKYIVYVKLMNIIHVWLSSSKSLYFFLKTLSGRHLITIGIVSQVCDAITLISSRKWSVQIWYYIYGCQKLMKRDHGVQGMFLFCCIVNYAQGNQFST